MVKSGMLTPNLLREMVIKVGGWLMVPGCDWLAMPV